MASVASGRGFGQYCGLARALELVGERWALLIIRDLLVGPRRFGQLRHGLPRIPTNVLSERLKELERDGIVRRRVLPRPATGVVYELTEYGSQLDAAVRHLGLWGAQRLGEPAPDEILTPDSMTLALRSTFVPEAAAQTRLNYELRLGPIVLHARIENGALTVTQTPPPGPDLVIEAGPATIDQTAITGQTPLPDAKGHSEAGPATTDQTATLGQTATVIGQTPPARADLVIEAGPAIKHLLSGELTPEQACDQGLVNLHGPAELLQRFVEMFHIPSQAASSPNA